MIMAFITLKCRLVALIKTAALFLIARRCSCVRLFCECVGLFCGCAGRFCGCAGLFCGYVGLFCGCVGLFKYWYTRSVSIAVAASLIARERSIGFFAQNNSIYENVYTHTHQKCLLAVALLSLIARETSIIISERKDPIIEMYILVHIYTHTPKAPRWRWPYPWLQERDPSYFPRETTHTQSQRIEQKRSLTRTE